MMQNDTDLFGKCNMEKALWQGTWNMKYDKKIVIQNCVANIHQLVGLLYDERSGKFWQKKIERRKIQTRAQSDENYDQTSAKDWSPENYGESFDKNMENCPDITLLGKVTELEDTLENGFMPWHTFWTGRQGV